MQADVEKVEYLLAWGLQSPNAEAYVADGRALLESVALGVHARRDPGLDIEEESREFIRRTRSAFTDVAIGRALSQAGFGAKDGAAAVASGQFDPFA